MKQNNSKNGKISTLHFYLQPVHIILSVIKSNGHDKQVITNRRIKELIMSYENKSKQHTIFQKLSIEEQAYLSDIKPLWDIIIIGELYER